MNSDQCEFGLNDARLRISWDGRSPRELTKGFRQACAVDNSGVEWASREAERFGANPAQLTMFLKGTPNGT